MNVQYMLKYKTKIHVSLLFYYDDHKLSIGGYLQLTTLWLQAC